jgi:hypothetical protein
MDWESNAIGRELAFCAPFTVTPAGIVSELNVKTAISSFAVAPFEGE